MEQSILKSTKKNLGVVGDAFDEEIMTGINSAFSTLTQLGLGPETGFTVEDDEPEWDSFITTTAGDKRYSGVKLFIQLSTKLHFDPPATSYVLASMERQIEELKWRLNDVREHDKYTDPPEDDPEEPEDE